MNFQKTNYTLKRFKSSLIFTIALLVSTVFSFNLFSEDQYTLNSPLAGTWYTADSTSLKRQLKQYLSNVKGKEFEDTIALILPHAGYAYSGQTAAYGVKEIVGRDFSKVIILGPSHRTYLKNKICVPKNYKSIKTPLGKTEIDEASINELRTHPEVISNDNIQYNEHSIQIELPLLQTALKQFKLIPVVVGQLDRDAVEKIASILRPLIDKHTLIIASSDFTHYGSNYSYTPFPIDFQTEKRIKEYDMGAVEKIIDLNLDDFEKYTTETGITVCGTNPIKILLSILPSESKPILLNYSTSGKQMNDFSNSVSYVSMAFTGEWNNTKSNTRTDNITGQTDKVLTQEDKENLLKLARETLVYYMKNRKMPTPDELSIEITPNMKKTMGAFVTLHKYGMLRGCIGEIIPRRPLYEAVMSQAVNSALRDYRFPQVRENEISSIEFEISALTPPTPISSYNDIVLGRDGIIISKNGRSAVFLPQVAPEQGWNLEQTLSHLSQKAGLPSDAWKNNTSFTTFRAIVFSEDKK